MKAITNRFMAYCSLFVMTLPFLTMQMHGEGSKELTTPGSASSYRPFLEWTTDTQIGIPRRTIVQVYAISGERLRLGSSALADYLHTGVGAIKVIDPNGNTVVNFDGNSFGNTDDGVIENRTEELNGPNLNGMTNGYDPYTYNVTTTGIHYVYFISPNPSNLGWNRDPVPYSTNTNWSIYGPGTNIQPSDNGHVAAWDVTVTKKISGTDYIQSGRVWVNYLAINMGDNGLSLDVSLYVHTRDAYNYKVTTNGMDPFGVLFFSNNRGFTNNGYDPNIAAGAPLYKSVDLAGSNPNWVLPYGVGLHSPDAPDGGGNFTHKIFFNSPDLSTLPLTASSPNGSVWVKGTLPVVGPPTTVNITFRGTEDTPQKAGTASDLVGYENKFGGFFKVEMDLPIEYKVFVDMDGNNNYEDPLDIVLSGTTAGAGPLYSDSVYWDGRYGDGTKVPAGSYTWNYLIYPSVGEVHFPWIDIENHTGGFTIERLSPTGTPPPLYHLYWNDIDVTVSGGEVPPSPIKALTGKNSIGGAHEFNNDYGDGVGIDSWAYYLGAHRAGSIPAIELRENDLQIHAFNLFNFTDPSRNNVVNKPKIGDEIKLVVTIINPDPSKTSVLYPDVVTTSITANIANVLSSTKWEMFSNFYTDYNVGTNTYINLPLVTIAGNNLPAHQWGLVAGDSLHYVLTGTISSIGPLTADGQTIRPPDWHDVDDPDANGSGNNSFTFSIGTVVPVELTAFNARIIHDGVELRWNTATETNNYGFEVERASLDYNNIKNAEWKTVDFVDGFGTVNSPQNYYYMDTDAKDAGKNLAYRLKQIDRDGEYEYSPAVEVRFAGSASFAIQETYPNPIGSSLGTKTTIHYTIDQPGEVKVQVYDASGKVVSSLADSFHEAGNYNIVYDAASLLPGAYFTVVKTASETSIQKLVVQ